MNAIYAIRPAFRQIDALVGEVAEVRCECIAIEVDDVFRVDGVNGLDATIVPIQKTSVSRIGWFVKDVVSGNPGVAFVVFGEFFPEPDCPILEILVNPEGCNVRWVIRVPILGTYMMD